MIKIKEKPDIESDIQEAFATALLDTITPNLLGIIVDWTDSLIFGICIYEGPITEDEVEIVSDVEGEVIAHFNDHMIDLVATSSGSELNTHMLTCGTWVYRRPDQDPELR